MFGLFGRKKRDEQFLVDMMRAAAEGADRAKINQALGSVGVQQNPEPDNAVFSVKASAAIVRVIAKNAGRSIPTMDDDDQFVAGIFAFVVSNHVSRLVGAPFETVSSLVLLDLFGLEWAANVSVIADSYNRMCQTGRVIEVIGVNVARWFNNPTHEQMGKLVELFDLCRKHIS